MAKKTSFLESAITGVVIGVIVNRLIEAYNDYADADEPTHAPLPQAPNFYQQGGDFCA